MSETLTAKELDTLYHTPVGAAPSGRIWELGGAQGPGHPAERAEWVECAKATRTFDKDMVSSLRGDMDTLLVFASLFSAVVTAFVIQSYPGLSGASSADTSAALLRQLLLQAQGHSTVIDATASASSEATPSSVWINALWFSSLVLSLNTVLGAILAKQWLSEYELVACSTTAASPREQVALRQLTFESLGGWKIPTIIGYLPVQLICALFLFFAGLVYLVWTLNVTVAIVTSTLVAISAVSFLATTLLPSFVDLCAFCSPQSWLCLYLSKRFQHQSEGSEVVSFTDTWTDTFSNVLSHPSESRVYEIRGLCWTNTVLAAWEPSLSFSLYCCATSLPPSDMAKVIYSFWSSGSSPSADSILHARRLFCAIGEEQYWDLYRKLGHSILSRNTGAEEDKSLLIILYCSLHFLLCGEGSSIEMTPAPATLLMGLSNLAKVLSVDHISRDTTRGATDILSYIATRDYLILPLMINDSLCLGLLESLTRDISHLESHPAFPALSLLCIRLWLEIRGNFLGKEVDWPHLCCLFNAMRSAVQTRQMPVGDAITQWMQFGFRYGFNTGVIFDREGSETVVSALQELALCFRQAYEDGLNLADGVVELIDVLIVNVGSPEVISTTMSKTMYIGAQNHLSVENIVSWGWILSRRTVFKRLCDQPPLVTQSANPHPWQITCLQIICTAAHSWFPHHRVYIAENDPKPSLLILGALAHVVSAYVLPLGDLAIWFPNTPLPRAFLSGVFGLMVTNLKAHSHFFEEPDSQAALASAMRCVNAALDSPSSDERDSTPFIAFLSSSLTLATLYKGATPEAELVEEVGNLIGFMASFVRLHADDPQTHSPSIKQWLVQLAHLAPSPLLESPLCAAPLTSLVYAARYNSTIEGLDDVESVSQLVDWAEHLSDKAPDSASATSTS